MIISTGDPEVFAYLLQNLSLVSLVLGVTLPLIPPAIVLISLGWLSQRAAIPKDERTKLPSYFWQPWALIVVAVGLAMQMIWIFFTGSLIITYYLARQWGKYRDRRSQLRYGVDVELKPLRRPGGSLMLVLLAAMGIEIFLITSASWIPHEIIQIKDSGPVSGQVLSSDEEWTTFLDRSHHVQIARTENVTSRQPCHEFTPFAYKTLGNLILKHPMGTAQHHCPYY